MPRLISRLIKQDNLYSKTECEKFCANPNGAPKALFHPKSNPLFAKNAGLAIGPILFIVAILALIAAAIAAGSGSFTAGTTTESNRTKSAALIQIGDNLKGGMERMIIEGGYSPTNIDINVSNTTLANALFAPAGGGIAAPSISMANAPSSDVWYFVQGPINDFGTSGNEVFAVLRVAPGVCSEINNRSTGTALTPAGADLGNFASLSTTNGQTGTNWPTSSPKLTGINTGCVNNTNSGSTGTYFYEVMAIQ